MKESLKFAKGIFFLYLLSFPSSHFFILCVLQYSPYNLEKRKALDEALFCLSHLVASCCTPQASREGTESYSSCLVATHGMLRRLVIAALSVPTTRAFIVRNVWLYLKRIIGRSKIHVEGWF